MSVGEPHGVTRFRIGAYHDVQSCAFHSRTVPTGRANVWTDPLASQATAVETATFWLGDGGLPHWCTGLPRRRHHVERLDPARVNRAAAWRRPARVVVMGGGRYSKTGAAQAATADRQDAVYGMDDGVPRPCFRR
ncbi:hypothetical protein AB0J35_04565 [Nonomuraea angiospora]|uniref:hypothetical protein n=1 Tax=Nonomuraea angiospora TaxID=46172 RepID=UPI0034388F7D